jgi:hypothetical protein
MGSGQPVTSGARSDLSVLGLGGAFGPGTRSIVALEASLGAFKPADWSRLAHLIVAELADYGETEAAMERILAVIDGCGPFVSTLSTLAHSWIAEKVAERVADIPDCWFEFEISGGETTDVGEVRSVISQAIGQMAVGLVALTIADPDDIATVSLPISIMIPPDLLFRRAATIREPNLIDPYEPERQATQDLRSTAGERVSGRLSSLGERFGRLARSRRAAAWKQTAVLPATAVLEEHEEPTEELPWWMTEHPAGSPRAFADCMRQVRLARSLFHRLDAEGLATPGDEEHEAKAAVLTTRFAIWAIAAGLITVQSAERYSGSDDAAAEGVTEMLWSMGCDCAVCSHPAETGSA